MSLYIPASAYAAFVASLLVAIMLVLTKNMHGRYSMDETTGIQKAHKNPTPRIGGIAIVVGVMAAWTVAKPERQAILGPLLLAGLPAFAFGLAEDLTKQVSVMARLLATMSSGVLGWWITGVSITSVDVPWLDPLLGIGLVSVLFTAFAIGGVANAINIIDGFNGLASGFVLLALVGIAGLAYGQQDFSLALASLAVAAAVFGFWLVNWPWGKIFLGDGGSYFGGFALAWACVMLIERNPAITAFAALLATGMDLPEATSEALHYLDRCLDEGFRPGMGQVIPDRLFWALPEGEETDDDGPEVQPGADYFEVPFNETKH